MSASNNEEHDECFFYRGGVLITRFVLWRPHRSFPAELPRVCLLSPFSILCNLRNKNLLYNVGCFLMSPARNQSHPIMLIIAKNKVNPEELKNTVTPSATRSHTPIPHAALVDLTRQALDRVGLEVTEEEHAIARGGLRYFGGFALRGRDVTGEDRKIVLGLRNAHDKSFAASVAVGNQMLVCENLCFSSDVKLARRHTTHIMNDLPRVLSSAVSRVTSHWQDMGNRIESYKETEVKSASDLIVELVDAKAFPARDIYKAVEEFRNPRHEEFKGGSLWTLYNAITEHLKGGDLTKLADRTMRMQSIFDKSANHQSLVLAS